MKDLESAIRHCEEKEQEQALNGCFACAEEHKQLAGWLKELKEFKENTEKIVSGKPMKYHGRGYLAYNWEWLLSGDNLEREIAILRSCKEARDEAFREARRESHLLDEADGTLKGRGYA